MLIEFTVENFRSIKEPVTFSMLATKDRKLDENLIKNALNEDSLLKTAVIYGANASGKSSVLLALGFLKELVTDSHSYQEGQKIEFTPFKIDEKCRSEPTKISVAFIKDTQYRYNVSFNAEKIIDESLYHYPNNKKAIIFERTNTDRYKFTDHKKELDLISKRTRGNQLYLSKTTQENYPKTAPAFDWFRYSLNDLEAMCSHKLVRFTAKLLNENEESKKDVLKFLSAADFAIDDVSAKSIKISVEKMKSIFPEIPKLRFRNKGEIESYEIKTVHKGVVFDLLEEESEGTIRFFSLIGFWRNLLRNGGVLLVDELEIKLHNQLSLFLIKLFHDSTQNKKNAQLIFTTHNTHLLDKDLFRRDQIWFTRKNAEKESTDLYSMVEYKPRNDVDIEKRYLLGKYGAIPFIKEDEIF